MPYSTDLYYQAYQADDRRRQPVVLIHGAGGDHLSWPTQLRRLPGYRVYAPDLPGHGKSKGHGLQRVDKFGELIMKWANELGFTKFFLCGHSMGGAISLWLAIYYPDLVQGMILMGTGATLPVNLSLIEELANPKGISTAVDNICRWSFSPKADPRLIESVKKQMLKSRPTVLSSDFRACDAYDLSEKLDQVQIPTLILVGEEDKMTPLRFSEELASGIAEAILEVIPGAGHMVGLEKSKAVAERVLSFLEEVSKD